MKQLIFTISLFISFLTIAGAQGDAKLEKVNKKAPKIEFENLTHDFGEIPQNIPATYEFTFTNTGKEPLIVSKATASCGCTKPIFSQEPIKKKKTGKIKATFNARAEGSFNKQVTVFSNGSDKPVRLTIKGKVVRASATAK